MQLLLERTALPLPVTMTKDSSSGNFEVKEKMSSASVLVMNPVASGDNVTTGRNSGHKLKEELPQLIPCCEGKELRISEDLVRCGLSAISIKHDGVIQCVSMSRATDKVQPPLGLMKHRNSFRCLHRPDLKRVPFLRRMSPDELESLFRGYSDIPIYTNKAGRIIDREETPRLVLPPPDENIQTRDQKLKDINSQENSLGTNTLHPILETRSGVEDVPAGMRLHGARARLYTAVLAGARAGDQLDAISTTEEFDQRIPDEALPEDEVQFNEELQIILPPRADDVTAESSQTTTSTYGSVN